MGHGHNLAILRGLIKFKSNTQKIWGVLILLSIVTTVEVALGIYKPESLMIKVLGMKLLNWIFIILTIVKAYYITWDFMHMRDETKALRRMVVWTAIFLILYLIFILLQEGGYVFDVYSSGYVKRDF
ncbi:cytochrome C oxidase subunit IV family protein [Aestuariivivens sediminicola]|uniref:cytochrome C oxidase subunit IV family protein n=1 Tax=Aestuariivivens sediminicola TaxID=2913560 RepID=UPI001F59D0D5|nr:cytochrome C oxidase subunit IV family protein [Aestuariivivens sediminicola]